VAFPIWNKSLKQGFLISKYNLIISNNKTKLKLKERGNLIWNKSSKKINFYGKSKLELLPSFHLFFHLQFIFSIVDSSFLNLSSTPKLFHLFFSNRFTPSFIIPTPSFSQHHHC